MFSLDPAQESALADPLVMLRLYKRVAYGLVPRPHPDATRAFLPTFVSVDARYTESRNRVVDAAELLTAVAPIFPPSLLSQRELSVLLSVLPLTEEAVADEDGDADEGRGAARARRGRRGSAMQGVRPGSVTLALRDMVPFQSWQISETVAAARRAVQGSTVMTPFEEHVVDVLDWQSNRRRQAAEPAPPPLQRWEAMAFMEATSALTSSQSHHLLHYCACAGDDAADDAKASREPAPGTRRALDCDVELLHQLLFSETIPSVAEYPLLMGRFAEATLEVGEAEGGTGGPHTGTLALHSSLTAMELQYPPHGRAAAADLDFGTLTRAELSPRQFFYVCKRLRTGFRQEESDQLFYYLKKDHDTEDGVLVADLVAAYRQYFPPVPVSTLQLVRAAVTRWVRRGAAEVPAFVQLYAALREWGAARVPIKPYISALRAAGVPDGVGGVLDVELEWLRLKAPTRVDLLLLLCTPVPPSRAAVMQKLFERLDADQSGVVSCAVVLQRCRPELIEGNAVRRRVAQWQAALADYTAELEEEALDYEVFAYFWYMISAGVDDDPTFTMAVWQAFGLADGGGKAQRGRRS